jgi:DNA-binding response OmpR family regulator
LSGVNERCMTLQALVVSKDDNAAEILSRTLAGFDMAAERFSDAEIAHSRLGEQRFDALIVDFDEPDCASRLLNFAAEAHAGNPPVAIGLLRDASKVREAQQSGAKFILYKPLSNQQATATLRSATALLKRERRSTFRVPVQAPVQLSLEGSDPIEGIMLDLSQDGMDVLAAQPLQAHAALGLHFVLPDGSMEVDARGEVAWANPNGQCGVRLIDLPAETSDKLKAWLYANAPELPPEEAEPVSQCKLTDLSLGGCYVATESPFPEQALVDLCLKAGEMEIHLDGMVRVMHPANGMGLEFPSRTLEQREAVSNFIEFLASRPGTMPELLISPRSIAANEEEFHSDLPAEERLEDPLLELLRSGQSMSRDEFVAELERQRNASAATAAS